MIKYLERKVCKSDWELDNTWIIEQQSIGSVWKLQQSSYTLMKEGENTYSFCTLAEQDDVRVLHLTP